ncbi:hypothetical protein LCP963914a_9139 [Penicillium roqueforti]|nr:hypothetical protein LCP963914a_9139 [Penicillium roqueforti]
MPSPRTGADGVLRLRSNSRSVSTRPVSPPLSPQLVNGHLTVLMNGVEDLMFGIQRKYPSVFQQSTWDHHSGSGLEGWKPENEPVVHTGESADASSP